MSSNINRDKKNVHLEDFGITRKSKLLDNGVRITVFNKPKAPIHIRYIVLAGSRYEPVGKEGLAHFTEHLIAAGTKKYPTKKDLAITLERLGGVFGASTNSEYIAIDIEIASRKDLNTAFDVLNQMILHSKFSEKTIETEREAIFKEMNEWDSDPKRNVWELWRELFFQGTEVGRSLLGTPKTLNNLDKKELQNYWEGARTKNPTIVIAGDTNIEEIVEYADKYFGSITGTKRSTKLDLPVNKKSKLLIKHYSDIDACHFMYGYRTSKFTSKDEHILNVAAHILGGGRASLFTEKLRYENGLVYSIGSINYTLTDAGTFLVKGATTKSKLNDTIEIIKDVFSNGLISDELIEIAKDTLIKSRLRQMQTSSSWVGFHYYGEMVNPDVYDKLDDYLNKIKTVTKKDINEIFNKYFYEDNSFLAVSGGVNEEEIKF